MKKCEENSKFDKLSITEIEGKISEFRVLTHQMQAQMYECLEYLRTTHRYKENPLYARSTFWEYLEDRWMVRQRAYYENTRILAKYPLYAEKFGIGLVAKMDRECGPMRVEKVMASIHKEESEKKTPLTRKGIGAIIEKYRKTDRTERVSTDWKSMYEREKAAHDATKVSLGVAIKTMAELCILIEKLKMAAQKTGRTVTKDYPGAEG